MRKIRNAAGFRRSSKSLDKVLEGLDKVAEHREDRKVRRAIAAITKKLDKKQ